MITQYMRYTFINDLGDEAVVFFLPDNMSRHYDRINTLLSYKLGGWKVKQRTLFDTKDEYVNARIDLKVEEIKQVEKTIDEYKVKFRKCKIGTDTFLDTYSMLISERVTEYKVLLMLFRRCQTEDIDIENEEAILLHDQFIKEMCKTSNQK